MSFFERTHIPPQTLGEIWQIADTENRGLLTKAGFCMVLRLIGHVQQGKEVTPELAFKPGTIPKFDGVTLPSAPAQGGQPQQQSGLSSPTGGGFPANALQPQTSGQGPIRVPPLDPQKVLQYSGLFERSGAQNGLLDGGTAKSIFERAGLPNETLGRIWMLCDREQRGALDQTEFIIAMHLLTSMKTRAMSALPSTLPPGLYEAAARRGVPVGPASRQGTGSQTIPRQFTGGSVGVPPRTQSPLARPPGYGTPPPQAAPHPISAQTSGGALPWLVTPPQKMKYDQFFATIDPQGQGIITGEQAVRFFSDSRLPEDTLATIWDLADINSEGQLNRDEFAVAMYLIGQQRSSNPPPLPAFLPPALVPPSMRQQQQQSQQSTAPAFDNAANQSNLPKSATEDLFGLDEPSPPQLQQAQPVQALQPQQPAALQAQVTGPSASRDPFAGSAPASPSSPSRFQSTQQQPGGQAQGSTMFKPFMPTSAFGASLAQQHTGGSTTSSQGGQARGFPAQPPSHLQQASTADDDLLGDSEAQGEESSKVTNDTMELANMSSQIGNLRTQMEGTQQKKTVTQAEASATEKQKKEMEQRLQQFRAQYETEVRTVKELETQLAASRESTQKLGQELAMLEGTYQDLSTQHQTVAQALQADQQENGSLKQRISQINAEVSKLKPEIEKMKMDARQQKGLVSINKKQLATNEGERDRLQSEKGDLEKEAEERARSPPVEENSHPGRDAAIGGGIGAGLGAAAFGGYEASKDHSGAMSPGSAVGSGVASPTSLHKSNPFFRRVGSGDGTAERMTSPPPAISQSGPTPSAFDALFGPSAAFAPTGQAGSRSGTPPATSFIGRSIPSPAAAPAQQGMTDSIQSASSFGEPTPSATPPSSDQTKDSPGQAIGGEQIPPPPPSERQFTPGQLPLQALVDRTRDETETASTAAMPPASRAGGTETPGETAMPGAFGEERGATPAPDNVPGAFPGEDGRGESDVPVAAQSTGPQNARDDFDSAFDGFGEDDKAAEGKADQDPFGADSSSQPEGARGFSGEFPPIRDLEPEDDESSDEEEIETQPRGPYDGEFGAPRPEGHGVAEAVVPEGNKAAGSSSMLAPEAANIAGARPAVQSIPSTASSLPGFDTAAQQVGPPGYEQSDDPAFGGGGERSSSNNFPPQYGGLLPSREDPTSPPPPADEPSQEAVVEEKEAGVPSSASGAGLQQSLFPPTPSSSEFFHDASSRPMSSVTDASQAKPVPAATPAQPKNAFDDFDDFDDLSEAKEAEKSEDLGFGQQNFADEFNPAFDSPAASMTNNMTSSQQQTPLPSSSNGFGSFGIGESSSSPFGTAADTNTSVQNTPQNAQNDWDAIFSGLDSDKNIDTSLGGGQQNNDPWGTPDANGTTAERTPTSSSPVSTVKAPTATQPSAAQQAGRALTPGTEHDDPFLKRLTGMGYPRGEALNALERYDYDMNKVCFSLSIVIEVLGINVAD